MLRKGALIFTTKFAGTLLLLLANILMNRVVGFENFGQYVFMMGFVNIMVVFVCFGADTFLKREIARVDMKESGFVNRVESLIFLMIKQLGVIWVPGVIITLLFLTLASRSQLDLTIQTPVFLVIIILLMAMMKLVGGVYVGLSAATYEAALNSFLRPLILVVFLLYLVLGQFFGYFSTFHADILLAVYLVMLASTVLLAFVFLKTKFKLRPHRAILHSKTNKSARNLNILEALLVCAPLALVSSTVILERNIDVIMLGALGDTGASALYYIGTRISAFFLLPLFVLNSLVLPTISRSFKEGDLHIVQKKARQVSKYSSLISLLLLLAVLLLGESVLALFGPDYEHAYYPMLILSAGNLVRTVIGPVQMVGLMCNMEKCVSKANFVSLFMNIVLNLFLIPIWGIYGAVMATVITRLGRSIFLSRVLVRDIGVRVGMVAF